MKTIIFYITSILTILLLCLESSLTWAILIIVDAILIRWCYKHISLRELVRYTGYDIWYKHLR